MRRKSRIRLQVEQLERREMLSTFYVAPTGSDGAGGSLSAPWHTLQHAADTVRAGDTVVVEPGTYAGLYLSTSGSASAPITFQAQSGVNITSPNATTSDGINLEGASYVVIDGFNISGMARAGIRAVTDTHVTIRNNNCDSIGEWGIFTGFSDYVDIESNVASRSQQQHGIYVSNSCVNPVIRNNQVWGNYMCGIHMNGDISMGGTGVITGALVEGNVIHDNGAGGGSGINGDGVQNSRIQNNLLYNNHASGISLYQTDASAGAKNNVVANNTIVLASNGRWALNIQNASTGNVVLNNILYDNNTAHGSISISADSLPGFVSDYNVVMSRFTTNDATTVLSLAQWQANTGQDLHSVVATPSQLFVNVAGNDYHLLASSPALDRGTASLSGKAAPAYDLAGSPRPSGAGYDIGAYELQQGAPPPLAGSSTVVASSATAAVYGQSITFTATVSASGSATLTPTGTVTFKDGSITLSTVTLSGGQASLTISSLAVGSHSITAVYGGDSSFTGSTSAALAETVAKDGTAAGLTSSLNPATAGQTVTFTAVISASAPGSGTPTGTVTFMDGSVTLGGATLSGSRASLALSSLAAGSHTITAAYGGDANFSGSTSAAVNETVQQPPPPPAPLPTASVSGPAAGVRGQALAYTLGASDPNPSAGSTFTFNIDWDGNGTVDQTVTGPSGTALSHVFTASGAINLVVTVVDSTGATSSPASVAVSVAAVALQTDPIDSTKTALVVGGTTGNDTITLSPANSTGGIKVVINGTSLGSFSPTGRVIVFGQAGDDTIQVASAVISGKTVSVSRPAFLFAGNGNDTLDVTGSKANNVLVGGTGNDVLRGGKGRDLLIGGGGSDSLYAGAKNDILIGGTTDLDANLAALDAVMAEWGRTDLSYSARVSHLNGSVSGGLNGGYYLNAGTVHDDQTVDYLYGNLNVLDWFLANSSGSSPDQVSGVRNGSIVTPI